MPAAQCHGKGLLMRNAILRASITLTMVAALAVAVLPRAADAGSQVWFEHTNGCYSYGYGQTWLWSSSVTAVTVKNSGDAACVYRAVQLNYWNGSSYTATGWDERTDGSNAAIGVGVTSTDAYSFHRLGFNGALYAQAPSVS